ncbi:hypothetical protein chiPu_0028647, partial [Chiloscyllium punctatum]|nr:hypothetical protein [Chiloscyllium punctatum]
IQSSVTEYEFSQEVYRQLQVEFWSKFYACCLQYQEALARPLALLVNARTNMVCLLKKVRAWYQHLSERSLTEAWQEFYCLFSHHRSDSVQKSHVISCLRSWGITLRSCLSYDVSGTALS